MKIWKILTMLVLSASFCFGQDAGVESVFDEGTGGRALGLAGAFTAVADDSSAVYFNPAGLGYLQRGEAMGLFSVFPFGTIYSSASAAYPTMEFGTIGAGFIGINTGDISLRDSRNIVLDSSGGYGQIQFLLAYGKKIPRLPFSLGANLKINSFKTGDLTDANIAFDAALLIRAYGADWTRLLGRYQLRNLSIGVCLKDFLSTPIRLGVFAENEAFNVKLGAAWNGSIRGSENHRVLVSMDVNFYRGKTPKLRAGLEYNLYRLFFLRAGFNQASGFVLGAGVFYSFSGQRFRLDYSLGLPEFGPVHKFSLQYQFGRSVEERVDYLKQREDEALQVKINSAIEDERRQNEDRLREIESGFSNNLKSMKDAADKQLQQNLQLLMAEQEATNKAREQRINEANRMKLEQALSDATNSLGQQNRLKIDELKQQAEKQRLEELQRNEMKARQELTNQRRILSQQMQDQLNQKVKAEKARADQEKKKAVLDEQKKAAEREQKIRVEQKTIRQDLLRAQDLLFEQEDFDAAIAMLEDILRRDPGNQDAKDYLFRARGAKIPPASYPQEARDAINLGLNRFAENKVDEAIQIWQKALEKYPDNWRLFKLIRDARKKQSAPPEKAQSK